MEFVISEYLVTWSRAEAFDSCTYQNYDTFFLLPVIVAVNP